MSSIPVSPAPSVTKEVSQKFHSLRLRFLASNIAIVLLLSLTAGLMLWLSLACLDYFLEIRLSWRQWAIVGGLGFLLCLALIQLARNVKNAKVRTFVSLLELAFRSFGQRIRTVLDAVEGKVSGPQEMLNALGHQTLGRWETLAPGQILPKRLLTTSGVVCALSIGVTSYSLMGQGQWKTAMLRALGFEIPYTTLSIQPGNIRVLEGKSVEVSLALLGRQNREVQLLYKLDPVATESTEPNTNKNHVDDQTNWVIHDLEPVEAGQFAFEFDRAQVPILYQFVTSVGESEIYRIDVQPLIVAQRTEVHVVPPGYTGLDARTFSGTDATVLERSQVTVRVETNHPLETVNLEIGEKLSSLSSAPASISPAGNELNFNLPTTGSIHWRLNATGKDGTPMNTLKGRLRVREDAAPSIRWQDPQDEIRVHTLAEIPMRAQVSDDFGVVETGIMFRIGDDEEFELTKKSIEDLADSNKITTSILLEELLPLESFALTERDYISYYAFAVDNREWGNQRVVSEVRYIDIRPLRQYFSEIELEPNQNGGGRVLVQLSEIIRRQRHLISRTRKLEKSDASQLTENIKVIDRMVQAESELAGLTRFLAEFFVSRGNDDVEALSQAEASMLQASDSMSALSMPLALSQEEDALRSLAEARRELEILLPKNNQMQQQQLSQLARQLQQKLRRDIKQSEQQLVDTLDRIANEQMQLSEQIHGYANSQNVSSQTSSMTNGGSKANSTNQPQPSQSQQGQQPEQQPGQPQQSDPNSDSENANSSDLAEAAQPTSSQAKDSTTIEKTSSEQPIEKSKSQSEAATGPAEGAKQLSEREQREQWFSSQVELLERLQAVEAQIGGRIEKSKLMEQRLNEVKSQMDKLSQIARTGELEQFQNESREAADLLREVSVQLGAMAASEAVNRVASVRDMTLSMADRERDLIDANEALAKANSAKPTDQPMKHPTNGTSKTNSNSGDSTEPAEAVNGGDGERSSQITSASSRQQRAGRRLALRAATVKEVLATPSEVGDVAMSDVNDAMEKLSSSNELAEKLAQSQEMADNAMEGKVGGQTDQADQSSDESQQGATDLEQALNRARDYADIAAQLETLYRQLVSPRIARIRQLEQQATLLNQQLSGAGGSKEKSMDVQGKMGQLQRDLKQEGMGGLAELLDAGLRDVDLQSSDQPGPSRYGIARGATMQNRVEVIVKELREQIQEMILLEVAVDRDAPVPAEYRSAVDSYFRTIAGEVEQ